VEYRPERSVTHQTFKGSTSKELATLMKKRSKFQAQAIISHLSATRYLIDQQIEYKDKGVFFISTPWTIQLFSKLSNDSGLLHSQVIEALFA
jgi:hypothetical protein